MLYYKIVPLSSVEEDNMLYAYRYMSQERRRRVDSSRLSKSKKQTLAGEWLLRTLIAQQTGLADEAFTITQHPGGKPFAEGLPHMQVSISHSGSYVAAALSYKAVGIDVEDIRPIDTAMAPYFCSTEELQYIFGRLPDEAELKAGSDDATIKRFLNIWTLKEAYFKCTGTGIVNPKETNVLKLKADKLCIEEENYIAHVVTLP